MATFADRIELKTQAPDANGSRLCPRIDSAMPKRIRLRRVLAERRKILGKKVAWVSGVTKLEEVTDEQVDILFVKNVPDWKQHKMPCLMDVTVEIREFDRNKRGARVLHALECHGIQDMEVKENDDLINHHLEDKSLRNEKFASFIVNEFKGQLFPTLNLSSGNGILDVAGGKGDLCRELLKYKNCVKKVNLIDPRKVKAQKNNGQTLEELCFNLFRCEFNRNFIYENLKFLSECDLFVGMHPDQPTELIIDCAFELNIPFCVVPCCVYPSLFPNRKISTGQGVKRYKSFIQYLLEKNDRIQSKALDFQGRNVVLYWFPSAKQSGCKEKFTKTQQNLMQDKRKLSEILEGSEISAEHGHDTKKTKTPQG